MSGERATAEDLLAVVELLIWGAFAIELAVFLWTAPDKQAAARTYWLDAVIVLAPFRRRCGSVGSCVVRTTSILGRGGSAVRQVVGRQGFQGFMAAAAPTITLLGLLAWGSGDRRLTRSSTRPPDRRRRNAVGHHRVGRRLFVERDAEEDLAGQIAGLEAKIDRLTSLVEER